HEPRRPLGAIMGRGRGRDRHLAVTQPGCFLGHRSHKHGGRSRASHLARRAPGPRSNVFDYSASTATALVLHSLSRGSFLAGPAVREPLVLLFRLVSRIAVALLEEPKQLLRPAVDLVDVVIRELAPLLLDLPLHLGPLALQNVLVHRISS